MDRRDFIKASLVAGFTCLTDREKAFALGMKDPQAGKKWKGWKKGEFQIHFIYTGVAESMFLIFPDGTTMLLDCGDHNAIGRGKLAVPVLPNPDRHAGEWIARYVERVNPSKNDVDYMMLSHYHSDHGGCDTFYADKVVRDGEEYCISGFSQAAETLNFKKAFDRCWPDFNDPIPEIEKYGDNSEHMKRFYRYMQQHRGLIIEKFKVGAINQVAMLKHPEKYPNFSIRNICGNGRIATPDGQIIDLYKDYIEANHPKKLNENGMSLGMIITYGDFKFYTAGDFSDQFKMPDGTTRVIEDDISVACEKVNVVKINHHGHNSMTPKLLATLQPQVYVSCVWTQRHNLTHVMDMVADRSIYPGDRVICPTIMPAERRAEDAGKAWMNDVAKASYDGGHVIVNVGKGGKEYSVSYLTAQDESMTVKSVMHFKA